MITIKELEILRTKKISNADVNDLVEISNITFESEDSEIKKTLSFMEKVKNPYLFKVGNIPVQIRFRSEAPSLQSCLEKLLMQSK